MAALGSNVYEMRGRHDMGHIPPMPLWVAIIRIFQAILAILILALCAFANSVFQYTFAGYGMAYFTFIWTLLFLAYIGCSTAFAPHLYSMWIHLGLEIATTFWWLVTFALLASEATAWGVYNNLTGYEERYLPANWKSAIDCSKASAGLGALEWVLFIITLVMFGILLFKHRAANTVTEPAEPVVEEHKMAPMGAEQHVVDPRYGGAQMA